MHGEFSSADASALDEPSSRILLYGAGSTSAVTLAATDQVQIDSVSILVGGTGRVVTVYDGANNTVAAGETILTGTFAANTSHNSIFQTPHYCQPGTWPKVITSGSGQVNVYVRGSIKRLGP